METTTCIVLCFFIVAWTVTKVSEIYFRSTDYVNNVIRNLQNQAIRQKAANEANRSQQQ